MLDLLVLHGRSSIPPTGGQHSTEVARVALDGALDLRKGHSKAQGFLEPEITQAWAGTRVEETCLVPSDEGCLVHAQTLRASAGARAGVLATGSARSSEVQGLDVAGEDVCGLLGFEPLCAPAPNTVVELPGSFLVLNEQSVEASSKERASTTVRALRLVVVTSDNPFGLPMGTEIIVAEAHADSLYMRG
jgi:hypothetical protein